MAATHRTRGRAPRHGQNWERIAARVLMVLWAVPLILAAVATPAIEKSGFGNDWYSPWVLLEALLFAIPTIGVAIAWQREHIGGIILTIEGAILCVGYPTMVAIGEQYGAFRDSSGTPMGPVEVVVFAALFGLPPLIAGALLWHKHRRELPVEFSGWT